MPPWTRLNSRYQILSTLDTHRIFQVCDHVWTCNHANQHLFNLSRLFNVRPLELFVVISSTMSFFVIDEFVTYLIRKERN